MIEDLGSARPRGQRISPRDLDPAGEQLGILLVSHSPTMFGGAERSLVALASDLGRRPGVDVTVVVPANGPLRDALAAAGVRTVVVPFGWSVEAGDPKLEISIRAMPAMMRLVSEVAPDVIITNTTLIPWFGYVAHLRGIPHAWYLREDVTASINFAYHPDVERTLACIRAWSDHVIVASEFMQRRYAELLARRDIQVVYPSISRDGLEDFGPRVPHEGGLRLIVAGSIPHLTRTSWRRLRVLGCCTTHTRMSASPSSATSHRPSTRRNSRHSYAVMPSRDVSGSSPITTICTPSCASTMCASCRQSRSHSGASRSKRWH